MNGTITRVHIRWMIRTDIPSVLDGENACFDHPWSEADFLHHIRHPMRIGMVAESGEWIVGYMIYELHRTRIELLNLAVHPNFRRRSIGYQMVTKLINKLAPHFRTSITLNVRETNLSALVFFRSCGFLAEGLIREHYQDTREDAVVLRFALKDWPPAFLATESPLR